ncbi:dihydrofolate reductase [Erythrobacter sp. 3-20A1M]|uniref:dihydrofolate reductase family protein n=1 Tax=Erythrobacter sp. 3-20A1M TaxID=2653850 RepID=UPI001BFC981D|nr:dihydrofolate reductase family protein [Erythrobacter sp. 3-20A1M]QWC57552.1 dihydrofolate reductase [Erythrobacter sp. 3-20A1M]
MARLIKASAFLSLDGVMQAPGGPTEDPTGGFEEGGWVFKMWDEGIEPTLGSLFSGEYDLLLGRRTYDIFAAYWPYVEGEEKPMGEAFDRAAKYVLTRGDRPLEWQNSHRLTGMEDVARLKESDGPDLVIQGSSTLYPGLLAAGLVDTLILMTYPVTLGRGKRLFGEGTPVDRLEMTDHCVTAKGTMIATYRLGGTLPPYPDEAPNPATSEREIARRAAMAEGRW